MFSFPWYTPRTCRLALIYWVWLKRNSLQLLSLSINYIHMHFLFNHLVIILFEVSFDSSGSRYSTINPLVHLFYCVWLWDNSCRFCLLFDITDCLASLLFEFLHEQWPWTRYSLVKGFIILWMNTFNSISWNRN